MAAEFGNVRATVNAHRNCGGSWRFSGKLFNSGNKPIELARFHYLDGELSAQYKFLELQGSGDMRLVQSGETTPAPRAKLEQTWQSMNVSWPRLSDPIHDAANWSVSRDTGAFLPTWNQPGWFAGFTGPGTAFGEIGFYTGNPARFFVGVLLDNVLLGSGQQRELESFSLLAGDWQECIQSWAVTCAQEAKVSHPKPPLVGYCSWYQRESQVRPDDVFRAANEFAEWPVPPGGRTIQIDDGWQVKPGIWTPNAKFSAAWASLREHIEQTSSLPGLWIAPTTVHETHPMVRDHPDWLQRLPNGEFAIHFANWGGKTYLLEPDRPDSQKFIAAVIERARQEGWRYLKVDFTYPVSTARLAWDRRKTSFETQRDFYKLVRRAAGPKILLNACVGEPARYALGQVEITRLGGDTGSDWPTVQSNLRRTLAFAATNGAWWQADPDVFYMRQKKTRLTPEENFLLTGTLGLLGGVFLTSDWPSQWSGEAKAIVREFWTANGVSAPLQHRMVLTAEGNIEAYRVSYAETQNPRHRIGLYNWSDWPQTIRVSLAAAGIEPGAIRQLSVKEGVRGIRLHNGFLEHEAQPAHSLRIAEISAPDKA
jgi:hypothetical protein